MKKIKIAFIGVFTLGSVSLMAQDGLPDDRSANQAPSQVIEADHLAALSDDVREISPEERERLQTPQDFEAKTAKLEGKVHPIEETKDQVVPANYLKGKRVREFKLTPRTE